MKEITRIITAQVTLIDRLEDEDIDVIVAGKELAEESVKTTLKKLYKADDVQVEIKDFVIDKGGAIYGKEQLTD